MTTSNKQEGNLLPYPFETTNELIDDVLEKVTALRDFADADYEHSNESGAKEQARSDQRRSNLWHKIVTLIKENDLYK
jgi:hypothetical protein